MKLKSYLLILLFSAAGIAGCSKDDKDDNTGGTTGGPTGSNCATAWTTDHQNEVDAITAAAIAYSNDASPANCSALKAAYQGYLDAIKPYANCTLLTGQQRVAWEQAVSDAEKNIDDIC